MYTNYEPILNIHLDGRILTEWRTTVENTVDRFRQQPATMREKLREMLDQISADWAKAEEILRKWGGSETYNKNYVREVATKLTCAGELHDHVRKIVRNVEFDNVGQNYRYKERFEEISAEYHALLERIIELLRMRAGKLLPADAHKTHRDDTTGQALLGRIQNLLFCRHLVNILRVSSVHFGVWEHPGYDEVLKLTATIERNVAEAMIDRAKGFEALRNERAEKRKSTNSAA